MLKFSLSLNSSVHGILKDLSVSPGVNPRPLLLTLSFRCVSLKKRRVPVNIWAKTSLRTVLSCGETVGGFVLKTA